VSIDVRFLWGAGMLQTRCWATTTVLVVNFGWLNNSSAATLHVPADFPTIQACIDAATDGDECVVAPGTYHETIDFLGKAITLRGSHGADVTTIDATGIGGSVVTCASGEGPTTVLDGFTITGGTGTPINGYELGGGMYNDSTSPTSSNCVFNANYADAGGAIYNRLSSPYLVNCLFSGNIANGCGGGMANLGGSPTVERCAFSENSASGNIGYGGGMYNDHASPKIRDCKFVGNFANNGGAMFNQYTNATISGCDFNVNFAKSGGGVLNVYWSNPKFTNCVFRGNSASDGGGGAMVISSHSSPRVSNCTFSRNAADFGGGGIFIIFDSNPTVTGCILWGNSPDELNNDSLSPTIHFSDIQRGLPVGAVDGGGNISLDPMFVRELDPGPDGMWDGVDDDYGDLRLQPGSPCIDAGDPGFVPQLGETDLEGHARVLCGRVDMGAYEFGIGDYDCDRAVGLTDFTNWSACMTGPQATALAGEPPVAPSCEAFDFDADVDTDLLDFASFQNAFLFTSP